MTNVAIIGAGQLGSRHVQALANCNNLLSIQVIDPSIDALSTSETRFDEVASNFKGKISFNTAISDLNKNIDIAIIATNSKARKNVIEQLVSNSKVKILILEKFLFTKESDYVETEKLISEHNIMTWVNCPRRTIGFYKKLQRELTGNIHFSITGNAWGLGCNGIHLLDLFAFLTQSSNIVLSNDLIDQTIIQSKRDGYIEFSGTITGHSDKHSLRLTSFVNGTSPSQIHISTESARYSIEEGHEAKVWISKVTNKWAWEEQTFIMPFQSQLTNVVVDQLIEQKTCDLTPYKESAFLHVLFLKNLISFMQKTNNDNTIDECLIT